ncbi:hypothetical protein [Piscirickettsia salmonis]|uniref:hypothetical protein n=1 Tax=Piscirickettsia salmonis TaxID=1238 RepID=UPI00065F2BFC|nr:hypothetical protein [Piscirickettsia salmonis]AKP74480.1 hypothetical protein PSLF89_2935 [Piscirickettsia salmonis LF-89 = ATCC VR-1361]
MARSESHRDADFFEFLTKEIDKQQTYQATIALEGLKFDGLSIFPSPVVHLTAAFLGGQETTELSRQLPDQLTEEQKIRKILWARLCEETAWSSSNSIWVHTSNPDKVAALRRYGHHEPDSMLIRNFIATAAQRRRHGTGETFCLKTVCRLLKRPEYSFTRAELNINKTQLTPDNLRMIACYGCIKSDKESIRTAREFFSSTRVGKGSSSVSNFFQTPTGASSPRLVFNEHFHTVEEHEPATSPEAKSLAQDLRIDSFLKT